MSPVPAAVLFAFDAGLVGAAAWWLAVRLDDERGGPLERFLSWAVCAVLLIGVTGGVLGLTGLLNPSAQLAAHALLLFAILWSGRFQWREGANRLVDWIKGGRGRLGGWSLVSWGSGLLLAVLAGLLVLAVFAQPAVHDALTYRLPRMALWLQEGRIWHFETSDARLNYMPWLPDLLGVWLLGATPDGYALLALPQAAGGVMLVAATAGLARLAGFGGAAALGAAGLLLGCANVAAQFTTPHTDLLTAGMLNSGIYLWLAATRRGSGSAVGGAGMVLAAAAKGTVLYFVPGLAAIAAYALWRDRPAWRALVGTALGAAVPLVVLVAPWAALNHKTYGGWSGPAEAVTLHHGASLGWRDRGEKTRMNLACSAIQIFDPHAQPWGAGTMARAVAKPLLERLPAEGADPHAFEGLNRRELLSLVITAEARDADVLGIGVTQVVLMALGVFALLRNGPPRGLDRSLLFVAAVAVAGQLLFQHGLVQWHPWGFRFLISAMPWAVLLMAGGLESLPAVVRRAVWALALGASAAVFVPVTFSTHQAGWQAVVAPERSASHRLFLSWRAFVRGLEPDGGGLVVAMPKNWALAAFLRLKAGPHVTLKRQNLSVDRMAASELEKEGGWLLTPVLDYAGREGRMLTRTWLPPSTFRFFGLAAHRRLRPGETPPTVLYANEPADNRTFARRRLLLRPGHDGLAGLKISNGRAESCRWLIITPQDEHRGELSAGGEMEMMLKLPPLVLSEVFVAFSGSPDEPAPRIDLLVNSP